MKRKFAAFDIDGTISRTSLFLQILDQLIEDRKLPPDSRQKLDKKFLAYRNREHVKAFREYTDVAVDILFGNLTTLKVEDYRTAVDSVLAKVSKHVYVYTRELIRQLQEQDYFLIALSGSEMYAVQEFSKNYNFDVAIGEDYAHKDGIFTGKATEVFHKKEKFLEQLIPQYNLAREGSIAVGDSAGDITMLEFVDNPIAFNPEDTLFQHAKEHAWKIVVERKNVIYELEPDGKGGWRLADSI